MFIMMIIFYSIYTNCERSVCTRVGFLYFFLHHKTPDLFDYHKLSHLVQ